MRPLKPLVALVLLLVAACSTSSTERADPTASAVAPTASAVAPTAQSSSSTPNCPNLETGGSCLGALSAGTHHTESFAVAFGYTSPADWSNEEDINGRYLLLPPGSSRTAADRGTGDFVAAYTPVQAGARDCGDDGEPGVGQDPSAIAAALSTRPGLKTTAPRSVSLGTLKGSVLDVRLAPGWTKSCPDGDPPTPLVPTISGGFRPELITHAVQGKVVVRIYLLSSPSGTVAVEIQDATGGGHLAMLDAVAQTFMFG